MGKADVGMGDGANEGGMVVGLKVGEPGGGMMIAPPKTVVEPPHVAFA